VSAWSLSEVTGSAVATLLVLIIVAYATAPLLPLFRGLLDGSLLPARLHHRLRRDRFRAWRKATGELQKTAEQLTAARKQAATWQKSLQETLNTATAIDGKIEAAEAAIEACEPAFFPPRIVDDEAMLRHGVEMLEAAFDKTVPAKRAPNAHRSSRLDAAYARLEGLLDAWAGEYQSQYDALAARSDNLDLQTWEATRLGDARRKLERYSENAYGAEFDWLWPRLSPIIAEKNEKLAANLAETTTQLDFSTLLIFLVQSIPLAWLPILMVAHGDPWLILLIGVLWPLATGGIYEVVVRSQMALGRVVAAAIDRYRLDVLAALGQVRPQTLEGERRLWTSLARIGTPGHRVVLVYASAASGAAG
jgi:hypothetical protein